MEQYTPFIQGLALILVGLISFFGGRAQGQAGTANTNANTIENLFRQINALSDKYLENQNELIALKSARIKDREEIDYVSSRLGVFEQAWLEVKQWFADFKIWVDEKGYTGYPPIPKSIKPKDTDNNMKAVK